MKTILYLGTDPAQFEGQGHVIHYPVIKIIPRSIDDPKVRQAYGDLAAYTHLIFTSKNAVRVFCQHLAAMQKSADELCAKIVIAIGKVTAAHLSAEGLAPDLIAQEETQEGVVHMLRSIDLKEAYVFLPRSSLSRPVLANFFRENKIRCQACDLYDTVTQKLLPKPDLDQIDEIIFTSPSTVKAFLEIFGALPSDKKLSAIGPITEEALKNCGFNDDDGTHLGQLEGRLTL